MINFQQICHKNWNENKTQLNWKLLPLSWLPCCCSYLLLNIRRKLVHSNHVFAIKVQLLPKSTYFVTTYIVVLCVTKSQVLMVTYVIMKQMDLDCNCRCNYNLWLLCVSIKHLMINQHMLPIFVRFHWWMKTKSFLQLL
jgi:hypothetical protein